MLTPDDSDLQQLAADAWREMVDNRITPTRCVLAPNVWQQLQRTIQSQTGQAVLVCGVPAEVDPQAPPGLLWFQS